MELNIYSFILFLMKLTRSSCNSQTNIQTLCSPQSMKTSSRTCVNTDSESNQGTYMYQEDELVWAKIIGYPWWPAVINKKTTKLIQSSFENEEEQFQIQYQVEFFGDDMTAFLKSEKITQYSINRNFYIDAAKKGKKTYNSHHFQLAVKEADEIANNFSEIEDYSSLSIIEEKVMVEKSRKIDRKKEKKEEEKISEIVVSEKKSKSKRRKVTGRERSKVSLDQRCLRKQMAVTLFKLLRGKVQNANNQEVKSIVTQLLKQHRLDIPNSPPSEISETFMALFSKLKQKPFEEIKSLTLKGQQSPKIPSTQENTEGYHPSSYIYVDDLGYMHKCSDVLTEVEITIIDISLL